VIIVLLLVGPTEKRESIGSLSIIKC